MKGSAARKLTTGIALAVLAVSVAGLCVQYVMVRRDLEARQHDLVQADMAGFSALYDQRRVPAVRQAIEFHKNATGGPMLTLLDRSGDVLAATHGSWPDALPLPDEGVALGPAALVHDGVAWLGLARTLPGGFPLMVARSSAEMQTTLAAMRRIIAAVVLGVALAALGVGHLASRWILARITRINALADQVAAGDLSARLGGPRAEDEFGLLETHIHAMLDRIEALNRATNHLSDTIAHELRTPLTRIRTRLARLDMASEDTAGVMADIRSTIRLFDSLLEIARAEATVSDPQGARLIDLSALMEEVGDLYAALADETGIAFHSEIAPGATVLGDRNLITQLVSNLLENAIKFTPAGENITLALASGQTRHVLRVADTGPGLPEGFQEVAFDRFTRAASPDEAPGHGIGLALVRAIALRHGAKVSLPVTEKGFCIEIEWPKVADMPKPAAEVK